MLVSGVCIGCSLHDKLVTCSGESYQVCDLDTSTMRWAVLAQFCNVTIVFQVCDLNLYKLSYSAKDVECLKCVI